MIPLFSCLSWFFGDQLRILGFVAYACNRQSKLKTPRFSTSNTDWFSIVLYGHRASQLRSSWTFVTVRISASALALFYLFLYNSIIAMNAILKIIIEVPCLNWELFYVVVTLKKKIMKNYFFRNRVRSDARKSSLCNRGHFGKILLHPPSIIVLQQIKSADIIRFIDAETKRWFFFRSQYRHKIV